ncbi:MAG TPA: hypothetical protein VJL78_04745, partial [Candidatus Nitrosocosmicus sp.]|nr:hypothetical protein [Candidatus Nitrosocosmicus sp.]
LSPKIPNIKKSRGTSLYHWTLPPMLVKKTKKIPIKKEKVVTKIMKTNSISSTNFKTVFKDNLFNTGLFFKL